MMDPKVLKKRQWPGRGVSMKLAVGVAVLVVVVSVTLQPSDAQQEDEKSLLALTESNTEGAVSSGEKHEHHDSDGKAQGDGGHVRKVRGIELGINPGRVCVRYCSTSHCRTRRWWWNRRRRCRVRYYCCQHLFQGWLI